MPYYEGYAGLASEPLEYDAHMSITHDRIPKGEVEIRRASEVTSSDGHRLGHVDGFLVDDEDRITHLVLAHGHLCYGGGEGDHASAPKPLERSLG